jgi:hypothetical protein
MRNPGRSKGTSKRFSTFVLYAQALLGFARVGTATFSTRYQEGTFSATMAGSVIELLYEKLRQGSGDPAVLSFLAQIIEIFPPCFARCTKRDLKISNGMQWGNGIWMVQFASAPVPNELWHGLRSFS